jgi:site-specific DNA-methyltransferase (cytosine-N4-specific)
MNATLSWSDGPVTLHSGDARQVLATLPGASVDCIVTSPPYWGLRDYGTGRWDGGRPDCTHSAAPPLEARRADPQGRCPDCGAAWTDQQHGLETSLAAYVDRLVAVFTEARRVLHPAGTMWLNIGDCYSSSGPTVARPHGPNSVVTSRYEIRQMSVGRVNGIPAKNLLGVPWRVAFALQATGQWWLRNAIVWAKTNPMPESVRDRLSCTHEMIFLLTPSPRYHFDLDAVRVPLKQPGAEGRGIPIGGTGKGPRGAVGSGTRRHGRNSYGAPKYADPDPAIFAGRRPGKPMLAGRRHDVRHPRGKNPGDVWSLPTRPLKEAHFAAYPIDIPLRCTAAGCRPGGTVLDPFSGAATTGLAALQLDRRYIGIDLNPEYNDIARTRLEPHLPGADHL